jgi:hypothetical protein
MGHVVRDEGAIVKSRVNSGRTSELLLLARPYV